MVWHRHLGYEALAAGHEQIPSEFNPTNVRSDSDTNADEDPTAAQDELAASIAEKGISPECILEDQTPDARVAPIVGQAAVDAVVEPTVGRFIGTREQPDGRYADYTLKNSTIVSVPTSTGFSIDRESDNRANEIFNSAPTDVAKETAQEDELEPVDTEPIDEQVIEQLRSHDPEDPYITDAIRYMEVAGEAGYKVVAAYGIEVGDGALAMQCFEKVADPVEKWRLHAYAHERKSDALGSDYAVALGEARAEAAQTGDTEATLSIETARLCEELAVAEPTQTDRDTQAYLLSGVVTALSAVDSEALSRTSREDVAAIIGTLVQNGRAAEATEKVVPALPGAMQAEAQELVTLHRALNGQMSKKELRDIQRVLLQAISC
ncbi:MAG TPA: hypothetical protein VLF60_04285 [Candidatus Saccharimonadales bacterium]|nr:hypothetical protein [Candidatus Saccharimonadales bacterium]